MGKSKYKILWTITFLPLIITAIVLPFMKDSVPMHYNMQGNIDRWGSKYENYLLPIIIIAFSLFMQCILFYLKKQQSGDIPDKKKQEASGNEKIVYIMSVYMAAMFGIMQCIILYSAYIKSGNNIDMPIIDFNTITNVIMGIFIIIMGVLTTKSRKNHLFGIRTSWSMENDQTWAASNQAGGKIFIAAGFLTIIESIFIKGILSAFIMVVIILLASVICIIYSYYAYKRYK